MTINLERTNPDTGAAISCTISVDIDNFQDLEKAASLMLGEPVEICDGDAESTYLFNAAGQQVARAFE